MKRIAQIRLTSIVVFALFLLSCGKDRLTSSCTTCRIFVSQTTYSGDLVNSGYATEGQLAADAICNQDANKPSGDTVYQALLGTVRGGATVRGAPSTAWPLKASTTYYRSDGTTIVGTTDADSIFNFPLTNAPVAASTVSVWTGLSSSWISGNNCGTGWDSDSNGASGGVGDPTAVNSTSISNGTAACGNTLAFYCVEQ